MGLLIYSFFAVGLGAWPRLTVRDGLSTVGPRLTIGYALLVCLGYLLVVVVGLSISAAFWVIAALAAAGIAVRLHALRGRLPSWAVLLHPAVLLLAGGGVLVAANGGVGYLPMTYDEFALWLANALRLHTHETWIAARELFHLVGYTPGWPIILALPWQLKGMVDFGLSAAAPFVFYVAVGALTYDVVVDRFRHGAGLGPATARLFGWAFLLLFLTAQVLGPLWSHTLLIEAPQTCGYAALLILVYASETIPGDRRLLEGCAGLVLASCYLIKAAAMLFVPAVLLLCLIDGIRSGGGFANRMREMALSAGLLLGPIVLAVLSWSLISAATGCYYRPLETFTPEAIASAGRYDWGDLAHRFSGAVLGYIASYKLVLTVAALAGFAASVYRGRVRAVVLLTVMAALYFAALYWFHLTCFGEYYFRTLNSIPRFTRVILWSLHAVGLVMLLDFVLGLALWRMWRQGVARLAERKWVLGSVAALTAVLGAWQTIQVHRGIVDVTTRRYQTVDPRIAEVRHAAAAIDRLKGSKLPKRPVLLILAQDLDSSVLVYANYFALARSRGERTARYRTIQEFSWSPKPVNIWQLKADRSHVRRRLDAADIIWPIKVDSWLSEIVVGVLEDPSCLREIKTKMLVRVSPRSSPAVFACFDKASVIP